MKRFYMICCSLFIGLSLQVSAQAETMPDAPQEETKGSLLFALTQVNINDADKVLIALERIAGAEIVPLFQTMLNGNLYYVKESHQLVSVVKEGDRTHYSDMLSGTALAALEKSDIKKIRVNNNLRRYLSDAISRIELTHAKASVREAAVRTLLGNVNAETFNIIQVLRQTEKDKAVHTMMDLAIASYQVNHSADIAVKLDAIELMSDSLEIEIRNILAQLAEKSDDVLIKKAAASGVKDIAQRAEMFSFLDQLFFGLSLGSVLLLAAIGLAITFGVMGVINMAHGEMIMLGAYTTYMVQVLMPNFIEYSIWFAIPLAFIVSGSVGMLIQRFVIRYLHGRPLETLLATFGISLILQQVVRTFVSAQNVPVESPMWMSGSLEINPVFSLTWNRLYIIFFALIVFFSLLLILKRTNLGLNVRAVSQNREMARAMGIRTDWVDAMTFGLGSGIAGIAGVALSQLTNVGPNLGQSYIIDSFMVVVFGGVGNLLGTLVAAFSLGIANKFLEPVTGSVLASILVLVFIILFIQKRPKGLFPQKGRAAE